MNVKEELKILRDKLRDLDFKYNILTPDERTSKFEEYSKERAIIRRQVGKLMVEIKKDEMMEGNDENDQHKRR